MAVSFEEAGRAIDRMSRRTVYLPRLTEEEAVKLRGLLLDLIDGREDYPDCQFAWQQPPDWRALLRLMDRLDQVV